MPRAKNRFDAKVVFPDGASVGILAPKDGATYDDLRKCAEKFIEFVDHAERIAKAKGGA